jgi:hypothetical protein
MTRGRIRAGCVTDLPDLVPSPGLNWVRTFIYTCAGPVLAPREHRSRSRGWT